MSHRSRWRKLGARVSVATSMAGAVIVLTSVIFFFVEDPLGRVMGVTAGLLFFALAVYYAARPFLRDERIYLDLRREVDIFLDLTRELHYAAIRGDEAAFESIKERVPTLVESLIETARKSKALGPGRPARRQRSPTARRN